MKVAINQSNYISWKGYFDMIKNVDLFILYDDVQYTRRDWRNRNKIKASHGLQWLTIPVNVKGKYHQKIKEVTISDKTWNIRHLNTLKVAYSKSKFFKDVFPFVEGMYLEATHHNLSEINFHVITSICNYLDINTKIVFSSEFDLTEQDRTKRLVDICRQASATEYISGPLAKDYITKAEFDARNIKLNWMSYDNYPIYDQLHGDFVHKVSILDLLFNCGKESINFLIKNHKQGDKS